MIFRVGFVFSLSMILSLMSVAGKPMRIQPNHVFVPNGFDSNDRTEVLLSGWLPSPCYLKPQAKVSVKGEKIEISLKSTLKKNDACVTMAYPFIVSAELGQLEEGQYEIVVNGKASMPIQINPASSGSVDDFIYAHVDEVLVDSQRKTVTLLGSNPSDCVELDSIKFTSNNQDTIAVLPIMKQVRMSCEKKLVPFMYTVNVPSLVPEAQNEVLLHVRSLDGSSINKLFKRN